MTAISPQTGELVWNSLIYDGRPLRADELLYSSKHNRIIGKHFNNIMIWDADNGILVKELSDSLNEISVSRSGLNSLFQDGIVYVGEQFYKPVNDIHVIDWNGNLKYSINIPWGTFSAQFDNEKFIIGQRNTVHGKLTQGRIRSFKSSNGVSLWSYQTDNGGFYSRIYIRNGIIYAGTKGNSPQSEVVALDAETGQIIWKYISQNAGEWTNNFLVTEETIFIKGTSSSFALDRNTGIKKWNFEWKNTSSIELMYLEGFVYMTDSYHLYILEEHTGELVHTEIVPKENGYYWHIAASKDKIFAQTSASIIAYEPWHLRGE